ncbi:MAG: YggT family protein [Treponema sp.]|nr:YggT family protein [Treponema sp.]
MQALFYIASYAASLYVILCFIRIILTWFPQVEYSVVGKFFSTLCDPYLNLFRRLPLRIGLIDFSPMISIGLLSLLSSVLGNIAQTGKLYIGGILSSLFLLLWSIFSSLITLFIIVLVVRLIVMLFSKRENYYNSVWSSLDSSLSPLIFRLTKPFSFGRTLNYRSALILTIFELILISVFGNILISIIAQLLLKLPF